MWTRKLSGPRCRNKSPVSSVGSTGPDVLKEKKIPHIDTDVFEYRNYIFRGNRSVLSALSGIMMIPVPYEVGPP